MGGRAEAERPSRVPYSRRQGSEWKGKRRGGRKNEGEMRREAGERERTAARGEGEGAPLKG